MQLIIDLEQETFGDVEDNSEEIQMLVEYVAKQIGQGYWSSYEPSWHIKDDNDPDTMYWLKMMRDQMRNGYHISEEDMKRIVIAVEEIEALRDKMLKEAK